MRRINLQLLVIALLSCVSVIPLLILPAMVGAIIDDYGMTAAAAGWSASLNFIGGAAASIGVSLRVRRLDLVRITAWGFLLAAAADLLSAAVGAHSESLFLLARLAAGVGAGTAYAAILSSVARCQDADRGFGVLMTLQFALSAVGLYAIPLILPTIGIGGLFIGIALVELLAILAVAQLATPTAMTESGEHAGSAVELLLRPVVLLSILGVGLFQAANTAQFAYAERMGMAIDLSPATIGLALGISSILGVPGAYGIVWLGERFKRNAMLMCGLGITSTGLLILLMAGNVVYYSIALCLLGFSWAFTVPCFQSIQADMDKQGSVVTAGAFATTIGNAIGPAVAAAVVGSGDYARVVQVAIAFSIIAALCMAPTRARFVVAAHR